MNRRAHALFTVVVLAACFGTVLTTTFNRSLPEWCAHPERPGNVYVQPLCAR